MQFRYGYLLLAVLGSLTTATFATARHRHDAAGDNSHPAPYTTKTLTGRVVWMAEALESRFGIKTVPEAKERILALQTKEGRLYPLVENVRGRSFRRDKRLRDMDLEVLVRQFDGSPMIQVITIYQVDAEGGAKHEVDYWCDICSIAMYELKPCDCCQAPIRLRRRRVETKPDP